MTSETPRQQIFLTGATGAMGLEATQSLIAAGHRVVGTTRSDAGARILTDLGATPVLVDLCDVPALGRVIAGCDVVAHLATSIPGGFRATRRRAWRSNDRLRRDGTAALIAAAEAVGIRRVIFESISLAYPDRRRDWIDESVALQPVSPVMTSALEAEQQLAQFSERGGEPVCLRFGRLYGAGRASDELITALRTRSMPIIGAGDNLVSSIHVADVGRAVTEDTRRLVDELLEATRAGNVERLVRTLATDVVLMSDGGGHVAAINRPLVGSLPVARLLKAFGRQSPESRAVVTQLNGQPAVLVSENDIITNAFLFDVTREGITAIYVARNPGKLERLTLAAA